MLGREVGMGSWQFGTGWHTKLENMGILGPPEIQGPDEVM